MTYRVCLVCMGNICRSPMAEVVLRRTLADRGLGDRVTVESAGTGRWHVGDPMDERALDILARHGYDGSSHRARQFASDWFARYDLVLAMDRDNLSNLRRVAPYEVEVRLFRSFDPSAPEGAEVPDPYYGGPEGFEEVLALVKAASEGVAKHIADEID
ncbi:low molecular weight phosphotyrosine protein phosphatase [Nonomuraea sp. KC401]|uniref:low molecular weight protein-tyrosine-phosphatase n=1 Tax=unclassified Nonomuraea TaxID=2593643 RepID=UPI0010FF2711|nr:MULTISPECIES: low molecular weight protein-tyrosine-phosphatase [unclassified Nonomuraea]NBE98480.1 low molecular weight phosphotyrosine protein phosphatase [Nonomuraea sp. K271]TLF83231.1 low molecular weight phosphotyrosine protein phosphatase [Nonomuraea sp. KC401]